MKLLIVANEAAGVRAVREIHKLSYDIVTVLTFRQNNNISNVEHICRHLNLRTMDGYNVTKNKFANKLQEWRIDLIINVHSPAIFCKNVLNSPKVGCFNLHPGPLPNYSGLNPVSWAIYNGETRHGCTLHKMTDKIDSGKIVYECFFDIDKTETALSLMSKCTQKGVPLLIKLLEKCKENKSIPEKEQIGNRRYYSSEIPNNGKLDLKNSADVVLRFIRAYDFGPYKSPWGYPYIIVNNVKVELLSIVRTKLTSNVPQIN